MALWSLSASPDGALYKDSITRFWGSKPQGLPYHTFSPGDIVLISKHAPGTLSPKPSTLNQVSLLLVDCCCRHAPAITPALMAGQQPMWVWFR